MFDKLTAVESSYEDLMKQLADPAVQADPTTVRARKTLSELEPLVERFASTRSLTGFAQTKIGNYGGRDIRDWPARAE